ncbi:MAG: hypothetical protein L3J67_05890 [Hyphomicrobiaceae bacterium]|nr:hypothetical protein [Hyphomicrobiaceae bacterium]
MWFFSGFWRLLLGFWRLLVGLVIGAILYVWMFFEFKHVWQGIHHQVNYFMEWLVSQPMLLEYSQWNTLLNLDDKLTFALFIMMGRIIWLVIEAVLFSFPRWLIFGRSSNPTPLGENGIPKAYLDVEAPVVSAAAVAQAANPASPSQQVPVQQGTGLETVIDTANVPEVPAELLARATSSKLGVSLDSLQEKVGNMASSTDTIGDDKTS